MSSIDQHLKKDREYLQHVNMHKTLEEFVVSSLKTKPENIFEFMRKWAGEKLGIKEEEPAAAPQEKAAPKEAEKPKEEQKPKEEEPAKKPQEEPLPEDNDENNKAATKIQSVQRQRQAKKEVDKLKAEKAEKNANAPAPAAEPAKKTDSELVRESWSKVRSGDLSAVHRLFYRNLFEAAPGLTDTVFKGVDMEKQGAKLMDMIGAAIDLLDNGEKLVAALKDLGERHSGYGAVEGHYPVVGAALLKTLEAGLGAEWNDNLKSAWTNIFGVIQKTMLEGASSEKGKELAAAYAKRQEATPTPAAPAPAAAEPAPAAPAPAAAERAPAAPAPAAEPAAAAPAAATAEPAKEIKTENTSNADLEAENAAALKLQCAQRQREAKAEVEAKKAAKKQKQEQAAAAPVAAEKKE